MGNGTGRDAVSDAELVHAARRGEQWGFGQLFARYRPQLYATALSVVGFRPEAEDAVHDAFVTALVRLGELRDPAAVGGWLHSILRNRCLMELRRQRRRATPGETEICFRALADETLVESRFENGELREWVWTALARLPEVQRAAVMLRYFGSYDSYEELAAILGVPVGTIRSRLSDAKVKLAELLLACARDGNDGTAAITAEQLAFHTQAYRDLCRGERDAFLSGFADDLQYVAIDRQVHRGRVFWDEQVDHTLDGRVQPRLERLLTSGYLTVAELSFVNPPEDPFHCPPGCAVVQFSREGRIYRMHHYLAPRPPRPAD